MKDKVLRFISNQIKDIDRKIRDLEYEDYDHDNIHQAIDFFAEEKRLKGSRDSLIAMRSIIENIEE